MTQARRTSLGDRTEQLLGIRGDDRALRLSDLDGLISTLVLSVLAGKKAASHQIQVAGGALISSGEGSPEGIIKAPPGSLFLRLDGGAGTSLYVKETGHSATGWSAK